jgi:hypothetical protein
MKTGWAPSSFPGPVAERLDPISRERGADKDDASLLDLL